MDNAKLARQQLAGLKANIEPTIIFNSPAAGSDASSRFPGHRQHVVLPRALEPLECLPR